ncbi:uncharacterized protein KY384_005405 [Bacidia gigantensis]|uniref:uncharacterized protein n=1 Tax=Bacidia gigantensis TaxID=2732470 RepID=UPI001D0442D8|nr:uncharacterized protein KY384_005405 [Bacidia gigantensis]KAG8529924.1 hypothetical protein KY384_005405 [Bacidia gigantensis]
MDDPLGLGARSLAINKLIRLSRLVLMVRQLVAGQEDSRHTVDTLTLAKSVFDPPSKVMIEDLINDTSVQSDSSTNPLGSCIKYSDDEVYAVAVFYYMWRNAICGIVHRVLDRVQPAVLVQYFSPDRVQIEDIEVAGEIAMSK